MRRLNLITLNSSLQALGAAALLLLAVGCGTAQSNQDEPKKQGVDLQEDEPLDITGEWLSACTPAGDGTAFVLDFDIAEESWDLDYIVYGDEACANKNVTVAITGPYTVGQPSKRVSRAYEAEFGFTSKRVTPHNEGMVGYLNSEQGCRQGWSVGESQEVFDGEGCAALGQYPAEMCALDYDLVAIIDGSLQFGKRPSDNNMCEPQRRPIELNGLPLKRQ